MELSGGFVGTVNWLLGAFGGCFGMVLAVLGRLHGLWGYGAGGHCGGHCVLPCSGSFSLLDRARPCKVQTGFNTGILRANLLNC